MLSVTYHFIDFVFPFDWASPFFMKNALVTLLILAPLLAMIGTSVVGNKMAFFSDALGHSTLTGIAIGTVLGLLDLTLVTLLFSWLFAIGMTFVKHKSKHSPDTLISVFASLATALGIVVLSRQGGFNRYSSFLIGDLLNITEKEMMLLALISPILLTVWAWIYNGLFISNFSVPIAKAKKIKILTVDILFTCLIATLATLAIRWVGILMVNAMLVLPATTANAFAKNIRQYHIISIFISLLSSLSGLIVSFYADVASGATIVLLMSGIFLLTTAIKSLWY